MNEMPCAFALLDELAAGDPWLPARMMDQAKRRSDDLPEWVMRVVEQTFRQGQPLRPFEATPHSAEQNAYFEQAKNYCADVWPNFTGEDVERIFYLISGITPISKEWADRPELQAIEARVREAIAIWDAAEVEAAEDEVAAAVADAGPGLPGHDVPRDGDETVEGETACDGEAAAAVGPGLPGHDVPRCVGEAVDVEIACDAVVIGCAAIDDEVVCDREVDGHSEPAREVVSGPAPPAGRTCGEASNADRADDAVKPMHSHAWVDWLMVVMAVVGGVRAVMAWVAGRDKSRRFLLARALRPLCGWGRVGRFVATALFTGRRAADGARLCTSAVSCRGPPLW